MVLGALNEFAFPGFSGFVKGVSESTGCGVDGGGVRSGESSWGVEVLVYGEVGESGGCRCGNAYSGAFYTDRWVVCYIVYSGDCYAYYAVGGSLCDVRLYVYYGAEGFSKADVYESAYGASCSAGDDG